MARFAHLPRLIHLLAASLFLAGLIIVLAELPRSLSASASRFGPVEVVEITAACTADGAVTGSITVSNRTQEPVSGQVPLILAQHIPPSRDGSPFFMPTGAGDTVPVSLSPSGRVTLSYGPLSTAGVDGRANALRVEVNTAQRPDINPERSESFPPCRQAQPTPTPTSPRPPGSPTPPPTTPPETPGPTDQPPATATSTGVGPTPTSEVLVVPPQVKPPDAGMGAADGGGLWSPWLLAGLALAASGATLSIGAQVVRPARLHRRRATGVAHLAARHRAAAGQPVRPLVLRVHPIDDFFAFVDMVRTLNRFSGIATARAVLLQRREGVFEITLATPGDLDALGQSLADALGSNVHIDPHP